MKLKKHQIKRLAFLMSKGEDTLTDPQRIELAGLKGIASSDEDLDLEDEAANDGHYDWDLCLSCRLCTSPVWPDCEGSAHCPWGPS